jgi:membrane fusion protein, copper/silver efflux system
MRARRAATALLSTFLAVASCGRGDEPHDAAHGPAEAPAPPAQPGHAPGASGAALPPGMAEVEVPYERRQLTGVRTAEVAVRPLAREIRTVGLVVADERQVRRIQTKVSGWVEELYVSFTGEPVRAGQAILAIYSPELVASQREYLLALETFGDPSRSAGLEQRERRMLLDAARRRLELFDVAPAHLAELERTGDARRRIVLHSPIAGFVTIKSVLQGTYVTPEMELYTVADLTRVWVLADVSEDEIPLVAVGQHAVIEVASAPGAREGTVAFLQPTLDVATRTLRVRFDVDNTAGMLRPGMYATVRLEHPLGDVLALPEEAVIDTGVRRVVFVEVAEGRFQPREVSLGRKGGDAFEVLAGLAAGERVAVSAQFLLDSESRLRGVAAPAHGAH